MTVGQDRAFAFLNDRYGDAKVLFQGSTVVRIEGIDEDGDVRARWVVEADGRVTGAWDPDYALDHYTRPTPYPTGDGHWRVPGVEQRFQDHGEAIAFLEGSAA